ncbi:MAG: HAD-IIA family hydrolase [bacterium]|nr:HAD-IIA family hydrolase [bacterium]
MKFSEIAAVVLDMDGVLWRGNEALPGMVDLFDWLREQAIPFALATNNSSTTPTDYALKLAQLGVEGVSPASIVTSSTATAAYLQTRYPAGTSVYVLGMDGIRSALEAAGFEVVSAEGETAQVVVVGIDTELTYTNLKRAALHIRAGAAFMGTNGDRTLPKPEGLVPGAGSILAALEAATDVKPTIIGKPERPMFEAALQVVGQPAANTLMVGDRLDTDIAGAQAVGLQTALVLTGVTSAEQLATSNIWPDVAYEDLPALLRTWAGDDWVRAKIKGRRTI